MRKNLIPSHGIPMFVHDERDLIGKHDTNFDSWYIISNWEYEGHQYGFEWHQQTLGDSFVTCEFFLMDEGRSIYRNFALDGPVDYENYGVAYDKLHVYTPSGGLTGDRKEMHLKVEKEDCALDITVRPGSKVLHNGTTGMLYFLGADSYQYAFPLMEIEGNMTIAGKTVPVQNTTAWFDRQWGLEPTKDVYNANAGLRMAWTWLGIVLNGGKDGVVSLWDSYAAEGHSSFCTVLQPNGIEYNVACEVTYEGLWVSKKTGNTYPHSVNFKCDTVGMDLTAVFLPEDPEFAREAIPIHGCQSLCKVTGTFNGQQIDQYQILELINDVCGDTERED